MSYDTSPFDGPLPPRTEPRRKPGEPDEKDSQGGGAHEHPPEPPGPEVAP